jgi:hypothetical protein
MTTFTTEDRIFAEKDGSLTVNVNGGSVEFVNKDLTDEEIAEEWAKFYPDVFHTHLIDFARAILKKASEK